jgi:hypothetical protein
MSGAVPLFPLFAFMECIGKTLLVPRRLWMKHRMPGLENSLFKAKHYYLCCKSGMLKK